MISLPTPPSALTAVRAVRRSWARARRDERGLAAVEFALTVPIFIAIVFGTLQAAVVWFAKTELQSAVGDAARLVFTNQAQASGFTETTFQNAICAELPVIFSCSNLMVSLSPQASISSISTAAPTLTYNASGAVTNTFPYSPGTYGEVMVLQVLYQFPVIGGPLFSYSTQANGSLLMVATAVFQNEPQ